MVLLDDLIKNALQEDIGTGDVTTDSLIGQDRQGDAEIIARESFVLAGMEAMRRVFMSLAPTTAFSSLANDGDTVDANAVVVRIQGPLRALLYGERVALNFLQHLSGIATLTAQFVEAVKGTKTRIVDTRKTLPGLRALEKYAVRVGGGWNHRSSLSEGVLIKENHIAACGGIREAVEALRARAPHLLRIEVEVQHKEQAVEALEAGADMLLLDNMDVEEIRQVVEMVRGRAPIEVSGRVHIGNVGEIARCGVDFISIGRLTHSAPAVDISMLVRHGCP